MLQQQLTTIAI